MTAAAMNNDSRNQRERRRNRHSVDQQNEPPSQTKLDIDRAQRRKGGRPDKPGTHG